MNFYEMQYLLDSRSSCILVKTQEHDRFLSDLKLYLNNDLGLENIYVWSLSSGMQTINNAFIDEIQITNETPMPLQTIFPFIKTDLHAEDDSLKVVVLKDMNFALTQPNIVSALREYLFEAKPNTILIMLAPTDFTTPEFEKMVDVVNYSTPEFEDIFVLINSIAEKANESRRYTNIDEKTIDKCVNFAQGLTEKEIKRLCSQSLIKYRTLNADIFYESRKKIISETNILEIMDTDITINDLGGNEEFKKWLEEVKIAMTDNAAEYEIPKSKGYLALGIPGTSKSLSAQIVANEFDYPLYKLNMSKIMDSRVGQSEQNIEKTINALTICSPCVLLIDEAEKTLSGNTSGVSDGGTMARVFGKILEYLSSPESDNVFTVMTSNDSSSLPPELTRAGRLDCTWYFSLPNKDERKEILNIHLQKQGKSVDDSIMDFVAEGTNHFTGAEIKETVKIAIRKAYLKMIKNNEKNLNLSIDIFKEAIDEVIPIYESSKEKIGRLENYCKNRARYTSSKTDIVNQKCFNVKTFLDKK